MIVSGLCQGETSVTLYPSLYIQSRHLFWYLYLVGLRYENACRGGRLSTKLAILLMYGKGKMGAGKVKIRALCLHQKSF